ncbi:MAG: beta-galactosidase [Lachnospiraceae bacterium]
MESKGKQKNLPIVTGDIKLTCTSEGYKLEVGTGGGSVRIDLEKGILFGEEITTEKYIVIPLRYDTIHSYYFNYKFYAENGDYAQADFGTLPYMDVNVSFPLTFLNLETVFMKRTPGRLKNMMHGTPIHAKDLVALELVVPKSSYSCELLYNYPYVTNQAPTDNIQIKPQVDSMGQWTMKDWPGKMKNEEEMISYLQNALKTPEEAFACNRSKYGGELSLKREGTGFFRIHEEDGVFWFCDPEGYLLFSQGMDVMRSHEGSPVTGLESLFEEIPPKDGMFKDAWVIDFHIESLSLLTVNLIKAFGENWHDAWEKLTANRLLSYGYNTVANWADEGFGIKKQISYVMQGTFPSTEKTLFRSMPDVFSLEYRNSARECAKWLEPYKNDPYMIGYFMRNEPDWAFGDYNLTELMLEKEESFATKDIFICEMVRKYNSIEELNAAWGIHLSAFSDLKLPISAASKLSEAAKLDTEQFTRRIIREYVRVPAEAYRAVDQNHLNLGLRYGWLATDDLVEGFEYCDVFSINHYKEAPTPEAFDRIHAMTGKPLLIGEFQVGSLDVGLMSNSMFGVTSQEERGVFYQYYLEQAAALPYMLGAHSFQWNDQPTLGRFDGENLNIGIVDVCNRPYEGYINGMKKAHARTADIHAGKLKPTDVRSKLVPKEGF